MTPPPNPLAWKLSDLPAKPTGPTVFSCFHCGGGSSMGYKLAGCRVLGGVDIDKRMVEVYRANLKPEISIISDIRSAPVPDREIDILDGSPPCTSFSMAGNREKDWGKSKAFSEGAAEHRLDDLFFEFVAYAAKVRPRVIVAENVTGMLAGNARAYVQRIAAAFTEIGYTPQLFRLSAAHFGVPQARERVFFVAQQRALHKPLRITGKSTRTITISEAVADFDPRGKAATTFTADLWRSTPIGRDLRYSSGHKPTFNDERRGRFATKRVNPKGLAPTLCSNSELLHWDEPVRLNDRALARLQSFPDDYDFRGRSATYVCGMSVPPFMARGIAEQIIAQAF